MLDRYDYIVSELNRYSEGIHILNSGIEEATIEQFEEKSGMCLPSSYKAWLNIHNGGELFALPCGTNFCGILGNTEREKGVFYLEDNFIAEKRAGVFNYLFIIGDLCDGELIAFDLRRTTLEDGCVVQFDVESGRIIDEWNGFSQWLDSVLVEGKELFDYEGNEK